METSGSAAEAITRTYEKKRSETSDTPPMTREERRAAEQKKALYRFLIRNGSVLLIVVVGAFFFLRWSLATDYPDLVPVTGEVRWSGESLAGFTIRFVPIRQRGSDTELKGGPSSGKIQTDGRFTLRYKPGIPGALPGLHEVKIEDSYGLPRPLPERFSRVTVKPGQDNHFEFEL